MSTITRFAAVAGLALALAACQAPVAHESPPASATPATPTVATPAMLDDRPLAEQLYDAVRDGDHALAQLAIEAGVDPNQPQGDTTPLTVAVTRDDVDMVTLLLAGGADHTDDDGFSALATAGRFAGRDVTEAILAAGADPNGEGDNTGVPLVAAASAGNLGAMEALVEAGAIIDYPVGQFEVSALAAAAYEGEREAVEFLLAFGADPGWVLADGATAAEWSATRGNREIAAYLESLAG